MTNKLNQIISLKGLKKSRLASEVGVGRSSLSRFLHGRRDLPSNSVFRLLEACGINLNTQLDRELRRTFEGEDTGDEIGTDLEIILNELGYLERKTLLESVLVRGSKLKAPSATVKKSLKKVEAFKQEMNKVRRTSC